MKRDIQPFISGITALEMQILILLLTERLLIQRQAISALFQQDRITA